METLSELARQGYDLFCQALEKQNLKTKQFQPGDYLLKQGQAIDKLYWMEMGQYTVGYTATNGRSFSLGLFSADNRLFGEIELLTDTHSQFDVRTNDIIDVKVVPVAFINQVMQGDPKVAIWLSQSLSEKYQDAMTTAMNRILHPLVYNIALDIQQRYLGSKPAVNFLLVYKEADRFGCSERVYRRVVNQLVDMDLIEKIDNQLQVKHVDKLIEFLSQ